MSDDPRPQRVRAIFEEALEMPTSERAAFLEARCGGNASLRDEVAALLHSSEHVGEFLAAPADAAPELRVIGPYKLLQIIGEGGFGTVYMAEQESPLRRRVALKVVKLGMDTKQVIARFEAERQALAM